jgi:hypothetical protein
MLHAMKRIWRSWRKLAHGIITVQNTVMLGAVFFLGIGPTAVMAKLTGRKLLDRDSQDPDKPAESHWVPIEAPPADMQSAQRPF